MYRNNNIVIIQGSSFSLQSIHKMNSVVFSSFFSSSFVHHVDCRDLHCTPAYRIVDYYYYEERKKREEEKDIRVVQCGLSHTTISATARVEFIKLHFYEYEIDLSNKIGIQKQNYCVCACDL